MAPRKSYPFLSDVDMRNNALANVLKIIFNSLHVAPEDPVDGTMYFDATGKLKVWDSKAQSWNDFLQLSPANSILHYNEDHSGLLAELVLEKNSLGTLYELKDGFGNLVSSAAITQYTMTYDSPNHRINLLADGVVVSYIDTTDFIIEGMLDNVLLVVIDDKLENVPLIRVASNGLISRADPLYFRNSEYDVTQQGSGRTEEEQSEEESSEDPSEEEPEEPIISRYAWQQMNSTGRTVVVYTETATPEIGEDVLGDPSSQIVVGTVGDYQSGKERGIYLVMIFNTNSGKVDTWVKIPIPDPYSAGDGIQVRNNAINIYQNAYWKVISVQAGVTRTTSIPASEHLMGTEPIVECFDNAMRVCEPEVIISRTPPNAGNVTVVCRSHTADTVYVRINGLYSDQEV